MPDILPADKQYNMQEESKLLNSIVSIRPLDGYMDEKADVYKRQDKNSHSYQESMKEMNYELDSSRNKITELESLLKEANMEVEELTKDSILPFDFDPNTIGAKEIVSERQGLYAATIDNCTVYVAVSYTHLKYE